MFSFRMFQQLTEYASLNEEDPALPKFSKLNLDYLFTFLSSGKELL